MNNNDIHKLAKPEQGAGILFVCLDDNTVLLARRSQSVSEPGTWGVPGGSLEPGENTVQAAKRETIEEFGSLPKKIRPIQSLINRRGDWEYVTFVVEITLDEKAVWTPSIRLNDENDKIVWFRLSRLPAELHSSVDIIQT
jgi:8-oxo-dGTP pyrophosphatase MutT (NUDIX family)